MTTETRIQYLLNNMPQDIYTAMFDNTRNDKVKNLTILLGLSEQQSVNFFNETADVLMGITSPDQLKIDLKNQFNLTDNLIEFAFAKLQEIFFNDLGEGIKHMQDVVKNMDNAHTQDLKVNGGNIDDGKALDIQQTKDNTQQILDVIKNISQKQVKNTANIIAEPVIVKEANPIAKPSPIITNTILTPKSASPLMAEDKPNKLLAAMTGSQKPKSKIDILIKDYNTRTYSSPVIKEDKKIEEPDFASPFAMKKTSGFITKGGDGFLTEMPNTPIDQTGVPDILKMKETRQSIEQNPKNIRLDISPEQPQKPVKYNIISENEFKPYQYEKSRTSPNENNKFVDLSEV